MLGDPPFIILMFYEWLIPNLIMDIVNNFHDSVFNKIRDPIFIDNKNFRQRKKPQIKEKTSDKGKNTHKVVYTIIDKLAMLF